MVLEARTDQLTQKKEELVARIKDKDDLIASKDQQLLQVRGLLNTRGIFEHYLWNCFLELQGLGALRADETFVVTNFITKLSKPTFFIPPAATTTIEFFTKVQKCGCGDLVVLYRDLSAVIHGMPWCGPSVKVYTDEMTLEQACVVKFIAKKLKLKIEKVAASNP